RRRHTRFSRDWSSDVCSSDLHSRGSSSGQGIRRSRALVPTTSPHPAIASSRVSTTTALSSTSVAPAERQTALSEGNSLGSTRYRSEERRVGKGSEAQEVTEA